MLRPDNGRSPAVTIDVHRPSGVNIFSIDIVPAVRLLEWPRPAQGWSSGWLTGDIAAKIKDPTKMQQCVVPKIHNRGAPTWINYRN